MAADLVSLDPGTRQRMNDIHRIAAKAGTLGRLTQMDEALAAYTEACQTEVTARETVRACTDALADAKASAEWVLGDRFVVEGNKTWLVEGDDRRALTADERKAWTTREAAKDPEVVAAAAGLAAAEAELGAVRARIAAANASLSAAKHGVDASVALLNAYMTAFPGGDH